MKRTSAVKLLDRARLYVTHKADCRVSPANYETCTCGLAVLLDDLTRFRKSPTVPT